jgi:hypothetical protein
MKRTGLVRWGGLAAMMGGVILAVNGSLGGPEAVGTLRWSTVLLLGMMVLIVALHLLQRKGNATVTRGGSLRHSLCRCGARCSGLYPHGLRYFLREFRHHLFLLGLLVATTGIILLGGITLVVGVLPRWSGRRLYVEIRS